MSTEDYVADYLRFHCVGSVIVLATVVVLKGHATKPVVQVGSHVFDAYTISLAAAQLLTIAIAGIWLGRAIAGARDLINPYRG